MSTWLIISLEAFTHQCNIIAKFDNALWKLQKTKKMTVVKNEKNKQQPKNETRHKTKDNYKYILKLQNFKT